MFRQTLTPMRFAYPGEAGSRNNFRGQGYFGIDAGLAKSWRIREDMSLKFAWEVFNVTNSVRFDTNTNTSLMSLKPKLRGVNQPSELPGT